MSDVNFTLDKGAIVGLLGINGAGKSTLMKILVGILEPDFGEVSLQDKTFVTNPKDLKRSIGYLSEENPLYENMYVAEYLSYVADLYDVKKSRILEIIEQTGLQYEYKKRIGMLSKGNKQRVGIAQALLHNPYLLILDEPSSGLDPNQRESINNLFADLSKDKIIIFSTHILSDVKDICSRFILIDKGLIIVDQNICDIGSIEETFYNLTHENSSR